MTDEDEALAALLKEFKDLRPRVTKDRPERRVSKWFRLVQYCRSHRGEWVELEGVYSNMVQRLKRREPNLIVEGSGHHFVRDENTPPGKKGRKVCTLRVMYPPDEGELDA